MSKADKIQWNLTEVSFTVNDQHLMISLQAVFCNRSGEDCHIMLQPDESLAMMYRKMDSQLRSCIQHRLEQGR